MPLLLRPLCADDEATALLAHDELAADDFPFLLHCTDGEPWAEYTARLARIADGSDVPPQFVPADFLVGDLDGEIVGRVSLRHRLNEQLAEWGGHIGYAVRPAHRRRGHATAMLRLALARAQALGLDRVMVSCDDGNVASATVIERCGGALDALVEPTADHARIRRYWVPTA
ncbi:MAG: GNAT family N-acetyltransferase [Jatrophihabitans sp.]|uniref:GNAT family N-acetyltransferase n=1 Tax=Jatrophihabitans sp. TaxID=1932789 RepID=UPI003F800AC4